MGDRAQVYIDHPDSEISGYLYTHWGAYRLLNDVAMALRESPRWDDTKVIKQMILDRMKETAESSRKADGPAGDAKFTVNVAPEINQVVVEEQSGNEYSFSFDEFVGKFRE